MRPPTIRPFDRAMIKAIECRFAVFIPPGVDKFGRRLQNDYHLVKENIHFKDGTMKSYTHFIENYEMNYWVTREAFAKKHKSKKEWEKLERLQKFKCTRSKYIEHAARTLGNYRVFNKSKIPGNKPWFKEETALKRELGNSHILYGADIETTSLIKHRYRENFKEEETPLTVACFDVETDMVVGHGKIIMATLSFKDRVITAVTKEYLAGIPDARKVVTKRFHELLEKDITDRKIKWELAIVNNDLQVIQACFAKAHEWSPDIVAIWNIDYEMTEMIKMAENHGVDLKDILSDPNVPKEYRFFEYHRGKNQKVTENGKVTPIKPAQRWHTVFVPASFYFLDAMCVYRQIRTGQAEEPSYALDRIMRKHLDRGKLEVEGAEHTDGPDWHILMQTDFKVEYIAYNAFDTIGMELLDEVLDELNIALPMQVGISDWRNTNSQPRRVCDELHFHCLKHKHVVGTTGNEMGDEFENLTIGLNDWITMLKPHPVQDNGMAIIAEYPHIRTNVHLHTGDLDVKSSYPFGECVFNISKENTRLELIDIEGISEYDRRMQGLNLSGGPTNAVEIVTTLFSGPTMNQMLDRFILDHS